MPATRRGGVASSARSKSSRLAQAGRPRATTRAKVTVRRAGRGGPVAPGGGPPVGGPPEPTCSRCACSSLGAIFALGLWTELAGPVGSALADGTGAVLGRARVAVPVACFAFGVVLLWPRRPGNVDLDEESARHSPRRSRRTLASRSAPCCSSSPTSASSTSPTGVLRSAATSTTCATPAARSARWSPRPLVAATGVVGASLILGAIAVVGRAARARALDRRDRAAPLGSGSKVAATKVRSAVQARAHR